MMFGITDLWLFVISGIALNLIPGPDSLYVIGRSASQGFKAGSVAALGIGAGTFVHIFAAAFGLSALLATSATAFMVIKTIGFIYLLYIGITMILTKSVSAEHKPTVIKADMWKVFRQGFFTNALNPKVALFFLAFVPQFIALDAPNKAIAFLILGLIFNFNAIIWGHILAWSSAKISAKIQSKAQQQDDRQGQPRLANIMNKIAGSLFLGFGIKLAVTDQ